LNGGRNGGKKIKQKKKEETVKTMKNVLAITWESET